MSEDEIRKEFEAWVVGPYTCGLRRYYPGGPYFDGYTEVMWDAYKTAYRSGRNAALEAAAKLVDEKMQKSWPCEMVAAIRALKEQSNES